MRKVIVCVIASFLIFFVSCTAGKESSNLTPLTEDELSVFNGTDFFNSKDGSFNIRNQFLSSLYDSPKDIDLFELFYNGTGINEELGQAEYALYGNEYTDTIKISGTRMDEVFFNNTGFHLSDTLKKGLDKFVYSDKYDAYYHSHGDTNYRSDITFTSGEKQGDLIRLYFTDSFYADGEKVLTIKKVSDGYLFVSNQNKS